MLGEKEWADAFGHEVGHVGMKYKDKASQAKSIWEGLHLKTDPSNPNYKGEELMNYLHDYKYSLPDALGKPGSYDFLKTKGMLDEEGKFKDKPVNIEATKLWLGEDTANWYDVIVGDAIVCTNKARLK